MGNAPVLHVLAATNDRTPSNLRRVWTSPIQGTQRTRPMSAGSSAAGCCPLARTPGRLRRQCGAAYVPPYRQAENRRHPRTAIGRPTLVVRRFFWRDIRHPFAGPYAARLPVDAALAQSAAGRRGRDQILPWTGGRGSETSMLPAVSKFLAMRHRHSTTVELQLKYAKNAGAILVGNAQCRTIAGFLSCYRPV